MLNALVAIANLQVHPDSWRPIGFMNVRAALEQHDMLLFKHDLPLTQCFVLQNAHYEQLRKTNALDDNLARRIDACTLAAS